MIPEAVLVREPRPYAGGISAGDIFAWEPDLPRARELVIVTRITVDNYDEKIYMRPIYGGKEYWNDADRFREAVVPTLHKRFPV